jgi:hypothetical protein
MRVQGFEYVGCSTGSYKAGKYPGLTLQFSSAAGDYYAIFNVILHYERNTGSHSSGDALPSGEFRVKSNSAFVKFWGRIGLQPPRRKSEYYKLMSKLKGLTFTAVLNDVRKGKLKNASITAELIETSGSDSEALDAVADKGQLCDSVGTTLGQIRDSSIGQGSKTKSWDKEIGITLIKSNSQANSSTCDLEYGLDLLHDENTTVKVIRKKVKDSKGVDGLKTTKQELNNLSDYQRLQLQSVDDWRADYDAGNS